jgi:hypothetical protein
MNIANYIHELSTKIKAGAQRFPLPSLCASLLTILVMPSLKFQNIWNDETYARVLYILIIGFFWFLVVHILIENNKEKSKLILGGAGAAFLAFAGAIFADIFQPLTHALLIFSVFTLVYIAPYILQKVENGVMWTYQFHVGTAKGFALFSSLILGAGISAGLFAIDALFSVSISGNIWGNLWSIILLSFAPFCFLANIPRDFTEDKTLEADALPKASRFMGTWILVPLTYGYLAILYCYYLKIAFMAEAPRGVLGTITIAFGATGICTWMAALPSAHAGNFAVRFFVKHFHQMLIIPTIMLCYAAYLRIDAYGFTIERYFVVLTAVWFFSYSALHTLSPNKAFRFTYVSLIVLALCAAFSPLNADRVIANSQYHQLITRLTNAEMLDNQGFPIPLNNKNKAPVGLDSVISTLVSTQHGKTLLIELFKHNTEVQQALTANKNTPSRWAFNNDWRLVETISTSLRLTPAMPTSATILTVNVNRAQNAYPINIAGYTSLIDFHAFAQTNDTARPTSFHVGTQTFSASIKDNKLLIQDNISSKLIAEFDLKEHAEQIITKVSTAKKTADTYYFNEELSDDYADLLRIPSTATSPKEAILEIKSINMRKALVTGDVTYDALHGMLLLKEPLRQE